MAQALEPLKLYDNFESPLINTEKWRGGQFQTGGFYQELIRKTAPDEHNLRLLNRSYGNTFSYGVNTLNLFRLEFTAPSTITAIRARVQVRNVESTGCPDLTPTLATAQILGFFFNSGPGDVIAGMAVRRRSDSTDPPGVLEIFYFVAQCSDPNCIQSPYLDSGVLGKVNTGEWVRLLVQWDNTSLPQHRFIFQRDSAAPKIIPYSVDDSAPSGIQLKSIGADNFVASCTGFGKPVAMVDALFDNVFVNQSALP
jgi:hypothetical protein